MTNKNYAVIGDVLCDLSEDLRKRFGVDGYLKGHMTVPAGKEERELPTTLDWSYMPQTEFYAHLKANKKVYKTAPASAEETVEYLEPFLAAGRDVLILSISSKLSVSYNLMLNAKKTLEAKYPNRKVIVVDSLKYSSGLGLLVIKACELRDKGLTIEENAAELDRVKSTVHQMGAMDDLFFVASKGRITHAKAFMGTLVGVKPMGDFNADGMVTVLAKVKGYDKAYKAIVEYIKRTIVEPENQIIIVAQTVREKHQAILAKMIEEQIKPKEIILSDIYPADGINVGPGLLAAYYYGTPITDLARETEVIKQVIEGI
ncbi:MAG: DegV family EDD domain-containing protein [Firmicutes bacterium]|nr:DegV family EDD domain-containing protein [Bacillota bacterium]